jgi:hypothetical protein
MRVRSWLRSVRVDRRSNGLAAACATACLLELVVHADDLAVSLGLEPVAFSEPAADLVVVTLSRISRRRHGSLAVIRSLARPGRAPPSVIAVF